jgi:hypothetical protein
MAAGSDARAHTAPARPRRIDARGATAGGVRVKVGRRRRWAVSGELPRAEIYCLRGSVPPRNLAVT